VEGGLIARPFAAAIAILVFGPFKARAMSPPSIYMLLIEFRNSAFDLVFSSFSMSSM
jgi:hypothetical protein